MLPLLRIFSIIFKKHFYKAQKFFFIINLIYVVSYIFHSPIPFCFIASFAFVLQRHRAKPIPLKKNERIQRLSLWESSRDSG